ncbi:MAG: right-handed parallel beta-helix repeat-containing protein, partial [Candidatus Coatesbacteria bacterium]|nr:right-handed parallel beta-helix repeat-containing protein [Candidatus Coatesbacteria bacterium]
SSLIRGNTISENLISGIFIGYTDDSVIIEENMIEGNVKHGIDCENSSTRIEHSSINSNGCAGIRYRNGSPTIECNVISGNQGDGDSGGGILCDWFGTSGRVLIIGNLIEGNSSYSGGGISCYSARDNSPIITHNSIRNNSAALGGGIYCDWGSSPLIFNNLICGNQATDAGGGLFCEDLCSPTLLNNTIAGNTAQNGPAGIFSYAMHSLVVKDNILWGNTSVAGPGDQLLPDYGEITFNCIQDWSNGGNSNISADPMLVDGPLGAYYLDPSSPCIDAGSQSAEDASLSEMTTQADGTPDTGTVDMGFHYPVPEE